MWEHPNSLFPTGLFSNERFNVLLPKPMTSRTSSNAFITEVEVVIEKLEHIHLDKDTDKNNITSIA